LGSSAVEYRSLIDLEVHAKGFLEQRLPLLHDLNRRLNTPAGERVEHEVVKLTYRFARGKNLPFELVEMVFSGAARKPVLFRIRISGDPEPILAALREKHGEPEALEEGRGFPGEVLAWRSEGDILLASSVPRPAGRSVDTLLFVFVENLEQLLDSRKKRLEQRQRQREGGFAF